MRNLAFLSVLSLRKAGLLARVGVTRPCFAPGPVLGGEGTGQQRVLPALADGAS